MQKLTRVPAKQPSPHLPMFCTVGLRVPPRSQRHSSHQLSSPCEVVSTKEPQGHKPQSGPIWAPTDLGIWCLRPLWDQGFASLLSISQPTDHVAVSSSTTASPWEGQVPRSWRRPQQPGSVCSATRALGNIQVGLGATHQSPWAWQRREDLQEPPCPGEPSRARF